MGGMGGDIFGAMAGLTLGFGEMGASALQQQYLAHQSAAATREARKFARWQMGHRMQYAMWDMERAGLNPILGLAKGGAPPGPNVPPQDVPGFPSRPNLASSARMGALIGAEVKRLKADAAKTEADAETARNMALASEAAPTRAWWQAEAEAERWRLLRESIGLTSAQAESTRAGADRTRMGTRLLETELPAASALEELYQEYPWLRKIGAVLKDTRR